MANNSNLPVANRVILSMRPEAQAFIAARWEMRPLPGGATLCDEGEPFTHAVFPHSGVLSLLSAASEGRRVENASIGNEGFVGFTYLMGGIGPISSTIVQVPGYASWLAFADLDEAMQEFSCVRAAMLRYSKAFIVQLMESVACGELHSAEQRVSRWLLHADDRMNGSEFFLTQEALARALGLRRATVSEVCSALMSVGAIAYSLGNISVRNRDTLKQHACDCYERVAAASIGRHGVHS